MNNSTVNSVNLVDYEIGRLPSECTQALLPLIFLTGLDVPNNPVHTNVWTSFSSREASIRPPASYSLMTSATVIPVAKRQSDVS